MALATSTALKNQILDGILNTAAGIDFDGDILEFRTGAAPGPDLAATGTLVSSITLPAGAFADAASGSADKAGTWEDTSADAQGTIAHFRMKLQTDTDAADGTEVRIEGTVTGTGGGGDIELDNTAVEAGQTITITSFTVNA